MGKMPCDNQISITPVVNNIGLLQIYKPRLNAPHQYDVAAFGPPSGITLCPRGHRQTADWVEHVYSAEQSIEMITYREVEDAEGFTTWPARHPNAVDRVCLRLARATSLLHQRNRTNAAERHQKQQAQQATVARTLPAPTRLHLRAAETQRLKEIHDETQESLQRAQARDFSSAEVSRRQLREGVNGLRAEYVAKNSAGSGRRDGGGGIRRILR